MMVSAGGAARLTNDSRLMDVRDATPMMVSVVHKEGDSGPPSSCQSTVTLVPVAQCEGRKPWPSTRNSLAKREPSALAVMRQASKKEWRAV